MAKKTTVTEAPAELQKQPKPPTKPWTVIISWAVTCLLVAVLLAVLFQFNPSEFFKTDTETVSTEIKEDVKLPALNMSRADYALVRAVSPETTIPEGIRHFAIKYTVEEGDSIFAIAKKFNLTAESILWANYDLLNDDPTFLSPGGSSLSPPLMASTTNGRKATRWQR